jgi:pimeloyl-ACP methyl ester carboxylesterase
MTYSVVYSYLHTLGIDEPATIVGHSMGFLIALRYAVLYPDGVSKLVLLNMPVYTSHGQAKKDITQANKMLEYAYHGNSSRALCNTWCTFLCPITKWIAPLYIPKGTAGSRSR